MTTLLSSRPFEALLVDDCEGDARLAREALRDGSHCVRLSLARDGLEALALLRREGPHASAPRPDLILMDLNMPRMDGLELLAALDADPDLNRIPVIVLTTSAARGDVLRCYELHASCYIVKPIDFEQFARVMESVQEFWFERVTLPGRVG